MAQLPDLHVSDSSEAMLSGRKPPFRLLVRAVASDGRKVNIRHAVSEGFVVRAAHRSLSLNRSWFESWPPVVQGNCLLRCLHPAEEPEGSACQQRRLQS